MANRRESGSGPGLYEDQEPCLRVTVAPSGSITFSSDTSHPEAPQRAHRLLALLKWFPLAAQPTEEVFSPERTERLSLADLALHLWGLNAGSGETPIAEQSDAEFREYLAGLGMLPGWFRKPAFLRVDALVAMAKSQANFLRTLDLTGYDEPALIVRLKRAGLTERMLGQEVHFDELRRPAFPILVERSVADPQQQEDFDYLRDGLAGAQEMISLADVEQLLLDRKQGQSGWFREYMN